MPGARLEEFDSVANRNQTKYATGVREYDRRSGGGEGAVRGTG